MDDTSCQLYARPDPDESGELPGGNAEGVLVTGANAAVGVGAGDRRRIENLRSEDARRRVGRGTCFSSFLRSVDTIVGFCRFCLPVPRVGYSYCTAARVS